MSGDRDNQRNLIRQARARVFAPSETARRSTNHHTLSIPGYDLIRQLHRGGQGVVYQAVQCSTGRDVAIKFLRHGAISTEQEVARLRREVQILGQLRHPSIVTIHDSDERDGLVYYVMDYIDGQPLDVYAAGSGLDRREMAELFQQIANAVQAAHVRGIIHRDLKPANILVDREGLPHVLDFGLAKLDDGATLMTAVTETGQFLGSLPWSAPEQVNGSLTSVDVRTDIYALGVVFWQTLTQSFPYSVSGDIRSTIHSITQVEPTLHAESRTRLDDDLETILRMCLAKDPGRRYQNAGELAGDLQAYLEGKPIAARRDSAVYVLRKTVARHRTVFSLLLALFILTVGAAVGLGVLFAKSQASARALSRTVYEDSIRLAERALADRNVTELRAALERAPAEWRAWEWGYLQNRADDSLLHLTDSIYSVCWSHDDQLLAASSPGGDLAIVDSESGEILRTLPIDETPHPQLSCAPTAALVAVGGFEYQTRVWNMHDGTLVLEIPKDVPSEHEWTMPTFLPDGDRLMLIGKPERIQITDSRTGAVQASMPHDHSWRVFSNGMIVTYGDRSIQFRDSHSLEVDYVCPQGTLQEIRTFAVHPQLDKLCTLSDDGQLRLYQLPDCTLLAENGPCDGVHVELSSQGLVALFSNGGSIEILDHDLKSSRRLLGHALGGKSTFSRDGQRLASFGIDGVRLWDPLQDPEVVDQRRDSVTALSASPCGRWFAAASREGLIRAYDVPSRKAVFSKELDNVRLYGLTFSPDGSRLVWNNERAGKLEGVDTATWTPSEMTVPCRTPVWLVDWSPRGNVIAVGQPGPDVTTLSNHMPRVVEVWSLDERAPRFVIPGYARGRFSLDGRHIAAYTTVPFGGSGYGRPAMELWNVDPPQRLAVLGPQAPEVLDIAWIAGDDHFISAHHDGSIRMWDAGTHAVVGQFLAQQDQTTDVTVSPDGRRLISSSRDGTTLLWDIEQQLRLLELDSAALSAVEFIADRQHVVTVSADHVIRILNGRPRAPGASPAMHVQVGVGQQADGKRAP